MGCAVCFGELGELDELGGRNACGTQGCAGPEAVCAACDAKLDRCVYCRAPFAPGTDDGVPGSAQLAVVFCSLLWSASGMGAKSGTRRRPRRRPRRSHPER